MQPRQKSTVPTELMQAFFAEFNADIKLNKQFQLQKNPNWGALSIHPII
jgi:hypothetical protein